MKKIMFLICVVGMALIFLAAKLPATSSQKKPSEKIHNNSCGYRIIEFGVGVNCKGDTVKLTRSKGFQQLASDEVVSSPGV